MFGGNTVKRVYFFVLSVFFISCTTDPSRLTNPQIIKPVFSKYSIPKVGQVCTVYVGEPLFREGTLQTQDAIILKEDQGTQGWTAFHPAGIYKKIAIADEYVLYQYSELESNGWTDVFPQIIEDRKGDVQLKINTGYKLLGKDDYDKKTITVDSPDSFEQTILFTGTNGSVVMFSYREFTNNVARPAFTIDLSFDTKIDNLVRIKGAQLEIIKYDNQSITYKLLSGFKS
jgi:hypothetical protein